MLYGIEHHPIFEKIDLKIDYPAIIAQDLIENKIDVGLVPVATIPQIPNAQIISDYGIAANGNVASVCIFSQVPIEEISQLYLDYQSRTSVKLAQILLKKYWKLKPEYLAAPENFIDLVQGNTAAVIIGDRAFEALKTFPYVYDLSKYWKAYTNLDFTFAAWVANKQLSQEFITAFNEANALGLQHIDDVVAAISYPQYDLNEYYRKNICFYLDEEKQKGLQRFLQEIAD